MEEEFFPFVKIVPIRPWFKDAAEFDKSGAKPGEAVAQRLPWAGDVWATVCIKLFCICPAVSSVVAAAAVRAAAFSS